MSSRISVPPRWYGKLFERTVPWIAISGALVFLNLPFWLWSMGQFISRPWINLDLLLPAVLMACRHRIAAWVALMIILLADTISSLSYSFHFHSIFEFLRAAKFLNNIEITHFLSWNIALIAAILSVCIALATASAAQAKRNNISVAVCIFLIIAATDTANGTSFIQTRAVSLIKENLAFSALEKMAASAFQSPRSQVLHPLQSASASTVFFDLPQWASAHHDRSIVLIVVESWGSVKIASMDRWLQNRLFPNSQPDENFQFQRREIAFNGSTTDAELRELCQMAGAYRFMTPEIGRSCLPWRMQQSGLATAGLHGFSRNMFDRGEWWPRTGLQKILFAEDITAKNGLCGNAFVGVCDKEIIHRAFSMAAQERSFVYALTLNSHLPLAPDPIDPKLNDLCLKDAVTQDVCQLTAALTQVFDAVHDERLAAGRSAPLVIIVGDHAPPFHTLDSRNQYSSTTTPAWLLMPGEGL